MSKCHRDGDSRACGATTIASGQDFVKVDGKLWAVNGDANSDGGGALVASKTYVTIGGKPIIIAGDSASADSKCIPLGGAHCAPSATGYDDLIDVA